MLKTADGFAQSYNAQAAVEIGNRLVGTHAVSDAPNDKQQLAPTLGGVSPVVESIGAVLIDSGFYSEAAIAAAESLGRRGAEGQSHDGTPAPKIYAATGRQPRGKLRASGRTGAPSRNSRRATIRPPPARTRAPKPSWPTGSPPRRGGNFTRSAHKPSSPCSGSSLRPIRRRPRHPQAQGLAAKRRWGSGACACADWPKVRAEWTLVTLAYNRKRLFHTGADLAAA